MDTENQENRNFDLSSFTRAKDKMIATNNDSYSSSNYTSRYFASKYKEYTPEQIADIIDHGSLVEQQSTRLEARFPSHGSGAMTRSPSPLAWRPDFPGAPREAH